MARNEKDIVYIVGAGMSAGLGFPTIDNLLPKLWERLEAAGIADDVREVIRFHHPDFNASRYETYPTIEELLSEMKANADLFTSSRPVVGGFTFEHLEERRGKLLHEMALWFHELTSTALEDKPSWLISFIENVKEENAVIISFNWDLVLDELLFGDLLEKSSYGLDRRKKGPQLIKPHGSLNWYKQETAEPLKFDKKFKLAGSDEYGVFAFKPLRAPRSKLEREYMPLIVPPVYAKQFEGPLFKHLWQETVHALSTATEVRVLGYSMAEIDFHARFVLRCGFYNQEHGELKGPSERAPATGRAKVVVVNTSKLPLKRIRAAVGWECEFHNQEIGEWIVQPSSDRA